MDTTTSQSQPFPEGSVQTAEEQARQEQAHAGRDGPEDEAHLQATHCAPAHASPRASWLDHDALATAAQAPAATRPGVGAAASPGVRRSPQARGAAVAGRGLQRAVRGGRR